MPSAYAPELVNTVLRALRQQMLDDGWSSELEQQLAGPSPSEPVFDLKEDAAPQCADEFEELTGAQLPGELVRAGNMEEIHGIKEIRTLPEEQQSRGKAQRHSNCTHQVGCDRQGRPRQAKGEMQACGQGAAGKDEGDLCSRTRSPARCLRGRSSRCCWDFLSAMMFRAQKEKSLKWPSSISAELISMAPMDHAACVELPQEDKLPEDGDAVGLLLRSMYGFRTASLNWQRDWQATLEHSGYEVDVAIPALF